MRTCPPAGLSRPARMRRIVLLPEPDGPIRPMISPRSSASEMPSRTRLPPYAAAMSASSRCGKPGLQKRPQARQRIGDEKIQHEQCAEHERRRETLVVENLSGIGELDDADLRGERGVLDEQNEEAEGRR